MRAKANLGVAYKDAGRLAEALPLLEEANRAVPKYPTLRWFRWQLLDAYIAAGRNDEAAAVATVALSEDRAAAFPSDNPQLAGMLAQTGLSLMKTKHWADAEAVLYKALTIRQAKEPDDWRTFNTKALLGWALLGQKKYAKAEPLLRAGYEGMKQRAEKIPPEGKDRCGEAIDRLIELAEATNKPDDAKAWKDEKASWPRPPSRMRRRSLESLLNVRDLGRPSVSGAGCRTIDFGLLEAAGMNDDQRTELTNLLDAARLGEPEARDRLTRSVYAELRRMAGKLMHAGSGPTTRFSPVPW